MLDGARKTQTAYQSEQLGVRAAEVAVRGQLQRLEWVAQPAVVLAVPFTHDGRLVLVRQYRSATDGYTLELPAGKAFVSGHGALDASGTPAGPFGKVPSKISLNDAQRSARLAALAVLFSLKTALGDLDRIDAWLMINGYVNADPGYRETTAVMNPCSELIVELYGPAAGTHARTAIGVAIVPLNLPVVISAEVAIDAQ